MKPRENRLEAIEFAEYRPRKIVNVHRHVDGPWFWTKYSAHPYVGCRSGCHFCYLRAGHYLGKRSPDSFDRLIQVKVNAVQRLRRELIRLAPDVISCGDWQQPAEQRYGLSRQMLEVILALGFPLFVIERSPLLTRDIDLLQAIAQRSNVTIAFSFSNVDPQLKKTFEPNSPGLGRRLQAMRELAKAGLHVGASLMPILPFVGDAPQTIDAAVHAIADHGGSFVLGAGMTMGGVQAERTLAAARQLDPGVEQQWRRLYAGEDGADAASSPQSGYRAELGRRVRACCQRHNIADRIPRYIPPGPLGLNKRIAERLFLRAYDLELEEAANSRVWAYRRAAWSIDEMPTSVAEVIDAEGAKGLCRLPGIGSRLSSLIEAWTQKEKAGGLGTEPPPSRSISAF